MGVLDGLSSAFTDINWGDIGKSAVGALKNPDMLKGIGSLAGAWGQYKIGKTQNSMLQNQLNYQIAQDEFAKKKKEEAQSAVDQAFGIAK